MSRPQRHSAAGRIRLIEKSNDLIGNHTRSENLLNLWKQITEHVNEKVDYIVACHSD
jgi:hypothetical protein